MSRKCLVFTLLSALLLSGCGASNMNKEQRYEDVKEETEQVVESESITIETEEIATEEEEAFFDASKLSEEEYKESCTQLYYDDVFFGEDNIEGELVKINIFITESYFFSNDDMLNSSVHDMYEKYNLKRDFYKVCVLREGTESYVGENINLYFSDDNDLEPSNYSLGDKVTIYGQIISYDTNTWDGYNNVSVIPRYIE